MVFQLAVLEPLLLQERALRAHLAVVQRWLAFLLLEAPVLALLPLQHLPCF